MLFSGQHKDLAPSLESIGAAFAIFEWHASAGSAELVSANTLFEEITDRPVSECVGRALSEMVPRYIEKGIRVCLERCFTALGPQEDELVIEREGRSRWWRLVASPVMSESAKVQRVIITLIEITEKKQLQTELEMTRQRYEAVVQTAYDGVISVDETQKIKLINDSAKYIFGVTSEDVVGTNLSRFIPMRFRAKHPEYIASFRNSPVDARPMQARVPVRGLRADGNEFPIEVTISKIKVGSSVEMTAVIRDISERVRLIEELSRAATHDALTGTFNRRHGATVMNSEIARCHRFGHQLSVVMFDIDYFKKINDDYGHPAGDKVLVTVAQIAQKALRETDVLCRWGGEEFMAVLPETSRQDAAAMAERIRALFAQHAVDVQGTARVAFTASFGVAAYLGKGSTQDALVDQVDKALYRAKTAGRNCCVVDDGLPPV